METITYAGIELANDIFTGIAGGITTNLGVLLPVGITLLGIGLGVTLIPRIIYRFF